MNFRVLKIDQDMMLFSKERSMILYLLNFASMHEHNSLAETSLINKRSRIKHIVMVLFELNLI